MQIRAWQAKDVPEMVRIWNEIIEDGEAFPQLDCLTAENGSAFFAEQTHCGVAVDDEDTVHGLYILHPNNVGRCGHISNASFCVERVSRGRHIGEALVKDCLAQAKAAGFTLMQFNAVVACNVHARHLYERCGFVPLGTVPHGFLMKDGHWEDICLYYHEL